MVIALLMSAELALPPERKTLRASWGNAARFTLPAVVLVTLVAELLLAERKYAIFGGGFGASRVLDTPVEIGAFLAATLACHGLILFLLYRLVRRLHRGKADTPLFHFNFAFFVGGGALAVLVAKFQALAFFSDAMSFQIVRNLGGGSLVDALKYTLSEAGLIAIGLLGAGAFYAAALFVLRKRWRDTPPLPDHWHVGPWPLVALVLATPLILFAANRIDDARSAAARFNGVMALGSCFIRRAISIGTGGAFSPSRSTGSRSTAAAILMRWTCPATAWIRTASAAISSFRAASRMRRPP